MSLTQAEPQTGQILPPETPVPTAPLPFGASAQIDQLLPALLELQGDMYNPFRNKLVDYVNKKGQRVRYRYATLSALLDMTREPLRRNGLLIVHFTRPAGSGGKGVVMISRLYHTSGQYFETIHLLSVSGDEGMQALGSGETFGKRYAICSLLNLAADDDDDGNLADGNLVNSTEDATDDRALRDRFNTLVTLAETAKTGMGAKQVTAMLDRWMRDQPAWLALERGTPEERQRWTVLTKKIGAALLAACGSEVAQSWRRALDATTSDEVALLRQLWETEWKGAIEQMRQTNQLGFNALAEHMRAMGVRAALLEETQPKATPPKADDWMKTLTPEERDRVEGPYLRDELGEIASDRVAHAPEFARMFVVLWNASDDRDALLRRNAAALAWAKESVDATAALMAGLGPKVAFMQAGRPEEAPGGPEEQAAPVPDETPPPHAPEATVADPGQPEEARGIPEAEVGAVDAADMAQHEEEWAVRMAGNEQEWALRRAGKPVNGEEWVEQPRAVSSAAEEEAGPPQDARGLPVPLAMPRKARGTPDLVGFVRALRGAVAVQNTETIPGFFEANRDTINGLPPGTRAQAMAVIAGRMDALGLKVEA